MDAEGRRHGREGEMKTFGRSAGLGCRPGVRRQQHGGGDGRPRMWWTRSEAGADPTVEEVRTEPSPAEAGPGGSSEKLQTEVPGTRRRGLVPAGDPAQ